MIFRILRGNKKNSLDGKLFFLTTKEIAMNDFHFT